VSFAVFGLGNKQYEHFNAMGKKAYAGLEALGAEPVVRRGDGDDDGCIDDDFEKWSGELMAALEARADLVRACVLVLI
jgi:NADPH-ferrihemoprotein reductase